MAGDGLDAALQELLTRQARAQVLVAVVDKVEEHAEHGYLVRCTVRPEGTAVQARLLWVAAGPGRGWFTPVEAGTEVLVLCPGGHRNRAVALAGLTGGARAVPGGWDNDGAHVVEPGGLKLTLTDEAADEAVVLESLLPDLLASLTELAGLLKALGLSTPTTDQFVLDLATDYRSASLSTDKA